MMIFIQFAITDLRPFTALKERLLEEPSWPHPRLYEFVRGSGQIIERTKLGLDNWISENNVCRIKEGIRFQTLRTSYMEMSNVNKHQLSANSNHLLGRQSVLCKYEFVFRVKTNFPVIREKDINQIFEEILGTEIYIKDRFYQKQRITLEHLASPLKELYIVNSTKHENADVADGSFFKIEEHRKLLVSCVPQIYIYLDKGEKLRTNTAVEKKKKGSPFMLHTLFKKIHNRPFRIWIQEQRKDYKRVGGRPDRELRISILRLFAEVECLHNIFKAISKKLIDVDPKSEESDTLQDYLNTAIKTVLKERKSYEYGIVSAISVDYFQNLFFSFLPGTYDSLRQAIESFNFRKQIKQKVDLYITQNLNIVENNISQNSGPIFIGNTGDIIIRDAFNKIKQSHGEDATAALQKVAELIEQKGDNEAKEMFSSFQEELARETPKKSVLKMLWENIVGAVPAIKSAFDIYQTVTQLF
jgi:hypothetical protein